MSWKGFWTGNGGISGEFAFGTVHIVSMVLIVILAILLAVWGVKKTKHQRAIIMTIAIFQLVFEVFWRIIYLVQGQPWSILYPFYPCNLGGILLPIAALCNNKTMKKIFYVFGFIGGLITFAMPEGIFDNAYLTFPILKSVLQHTGLILLPVLEYAFKTFRPKIKEFGWLFLGLVINLINSEGIAALLGQKGDYMFFRSGLPFVIPNVPQWLTFSIFGILAFMLISCALDPIGTKNLFLKLFRKSPKKE